MEIPLMESARLVFAMMLGSLKESLEQSIDQLRTQRLLRNSGGRSISLTSLSASDLDGGTGPESHRFPSTSPLKDYGDPQGMKRMRARAGVRFVQETDDMAQYEQLHAFHQSLRDLSSEQIRLGDDFNRELSRRSRSDAETKRALEELTEKLNEAQKQELVSDRVERRLQELEREMRTERELVERRQDQLGLMSLQLQEHFRGIDISSRIESLAHSVNPMGFGKQRVAWAGCQSPHTTNRLKALSQQDNHTCTTLLENVCSQ
ncbi:hypothetical protein P7K49_018393 [Saguinus oedipus]|uniref:Uncharacterized protein n=1 Tax=Saguinus oedipus TaxID=9490 RepID=A0ABQ9V590_SAGOE|nr:hypothetical protein P7K49_018393 [Saguinus oedipus]